MLTAAERVLFRRLGVFVGGWTLDAAEVICAGDDLSTHDVFNNLTQLVDKSLVIAERIEQVGSTLGGGTRFRFLETIRQYALEQLAGTPDAETFRQKHAQFFASLVARASSNMSPGVWQLGRAQIVAEIDNVRAALSWTTSAPLSSRAVGHERNLMDETGKTAGGSQENKWARTVGASDQVMDQERTKIGLHMVGALRMFWQSRGEAMEGAKWTEKALAHSDSSQRTAARAQALMTAMTLKQMGDQYAGVEELSTESESIWREIGDRRGLAHTLVNKGVIYLNSGRLEAGRAALRESQVLSEEIGDSTALSITLFIWGSQELGVGDVDVAYSCLQRSLAICRANGDKMFSGAPLGGLARAAWLKGNYEVAATVG